MTDLDPTLEENHRALIEFLKGNPELVQNLYSRRDDVTLANPFGSISLGWKAVSNNLSLAASRFRDEESASFERLARYETADLACIVEIERYVAKFAGRETPQSLALRVTSVFRREEGRWRLIARQADPRVELQPLESVFPR